MHVLRSGVGRRHLPRGATSSQLETAFCCRAWSCAHSAFTDSSNLACRIRFDSRCALASACTCAACRVWWRQTRWTEERKEGKQIVGRPFSEWGGGKRTGSRSVSGWNLRPILVLVVPLRPSDNNTHCQDGHAKLQRSAHTEYLCVFYGSQSK